MPHTRYRRSLRSDIGLVVKEEDVNGWVGAVPGEAHAALHVELPLCFQIGPNPSSVNELGCWTVMKGLAVVLGLGLLVCQLEGQSGGLRNRQAAGLRCSAASDEQEGNSNYMS